MKKLILPILLAFICLMCVCACTPQDGGETVIPPQEQINPTDKDNDEEKRNGGLDGKIAAEIRTAYYNLNKEHFVTEYYEYTENDISFRYYGEYSGAYVMFIDAPFYEYTDAEEADTIDGVTINYSNGQTMDVYYEGNFYSLQSAFDNGYLTHSDLVNIRNKHKNNSSFLYESDEQSILNEIKTAYYNFNKEHFVTEYYEYTENDISFRYYGEYNGAYVMFIDAPIYGYDCAEHEYTVDGVKIIYCDGQTLDVYYDGNFYSLQSAFENGLLTHEDVADVCNKHRALNEFLYEEYENGINTYY